ncbi:hybrid sensor histidine kinase/response regulator transcription factor [Geofilum rhodophaeum]|uniref:hybrid sensor histidine kinase/response regulator transcription factor n=1 Tax=Geofilum rhodophaeum TaxID=1965019 RepID=UPI000B525C42|nr:two-component regulator propeller domain-containing protein [Geofilum rhodophaeum]
MKKTVMWLPVLAFWVAVSQAQTTTTEINYHIRYLTIDEGLPQNTVNSILKDKMGYLWLATGNGLSRYDGYSFQNYWKPQLPSNLVNALAQDEEDAIWIGTTEGLTRYCQRSGTFTPFTLNLDDKDRVGLRPNIQALYLDTQSRLWIGTYEHGLFLLTKEGEHYQQQHFTYETSSLPGNQVTTFTQTRDGRLLIGTNHGLAVADKQRNTLHDFTSANMGDAFILTICETMEGDLWVGTYNGLWVFNPLNGRNEWFQHNPGQPASLSHNRVNEIVQDFKGNIYVATLGGVDVFQPETKTFQSFPVKTKKDFSLNSLFINTLEIDSEGNVWIGTEKGGVNHFNLYQKPFHHLIREPNKTNTLSENTINSLFVDGPYVWIGTAGGGLNRYHRPTGVYEHFRHQPGNPSSLPSDYLPALTKTPDGTLWAGTWGSGLAKMEGRQFKTLIPKVADPETGYENAFVSSLLYDERGFLFIGTEGGLSILDMQSEQFLDLNQSNNALSGISEIGCMLKDRNNLLWIGTRNGLYNFPTSALNLPEEALCKAHQLQVYKSAPNPGSNELPGNYITALLEDEKGNIWIGTYGDGLVRATLNQNGAFSFRHFTKEEGLSNHVVYAMEQDDTGYIWISTDYGLSRIDPETEHIDNFFTDDGLLSNQFYWSASAKTEDGELLFGSINGLNHFYPSNFPVYPHEPRVSLSALKIFNQSVEINEQRHGQIILEQPLPKTRELSLSYKDNVFSLEFTALDYFLSRKTKYAYQLEGIDKDWVETSSDQRIASYTNLKGDSYLFRVKASNSEGVWGPETHLRITIRPPFWQTSWFLVLLVLTVITFTIIYIKHHTKRLRLEKAKLERMVGERTKRIEEQNQMMREQAETLQETNSALEKKSLQIEGQKLQLEKQNQEILEQRDRLIQLNQEIEHINQNKLRFFTNISHEFRTPLTLIITPIERLLREVHLPDLAINLLSTIQRNARRLNMLIDQLLLFRKIESGNLSVRINNKDLRGFVVEIFQAFKLLAEQKNIRYKLIDQLGEGPYWYDREKLENILYNLLSNAFKYTPDKGEISLHLREEEIRGKSSLVIEVGDSGPGIPEPLQDKVFHRFYQNNEAAGIKGTGIGLALAKELTQAMNGSISVLSNGHNGSRFLVYLPWQASDFQGAEIDELAVFDPEEISGKIQALLEEPADKNFFPEASEPQEDSPNILIVEDNRELALFMANALSGPYGVLTAENGRVGYELARKHLPDLIISDVMMPEMNGIEMCKSIKSNLYTSHIPILLLSAKALLEDQLEGLEFGADDYIPKPFNLSILKAKVHNIIDARKKMRTLFTSEAELPSVNPDSKSLDDKFLAKTYEAMEAHYGNPEFNVELFSEVMFVSRSLLYKKLKALVDLSPNDFITVFRLKKALPLLQSKEMSVNEVAYTVGFNDPKYFSRVFKKFYKKTPSEYL